MAQHSTGVLLFQTLSDGVRNIRLTCIRYLNWEGSNNWGLGWLGPVGHLSLSLCGLSTWALQVAASGYLDFLHGGSRLQRHRSRRKREPGGSCISLMTQASAFTQHHFHRKLFVKRAHMAGERKRLHLLTWTYVLQPPRSQTMALGTGDLCLHVPAHNEQLPSRYYWYSGHVGHVSCRCVSTSVSKPKAVTGSLRHMWISGLQNDIQISACGIKDLLGLSTLPGTALLLSSPQSQFGICQPLLSRQSP